MKTPGGVGETFFKKANLNPNAKRITGVICGYRIEEIENPLTKQVRYLDKLVDELARGKKNGKDTKNSINTKNSQKYD